jgi:hypothetical protein
MFRKTLRPTSSPTRFCNWSEENPLDARRSAAEDRDLGLRLIASTKENVVVLKEWVASTKENVVVLKEWGAYKLILP